MALDFRRGNPDTPVGHAIVYFSDSSDPGKTGATYIMILPISVDVAKYVPPFLSGHLEGMGSSDVSGFAFPPAPELVEDEGFIERIAELRGDDLIFGGSGNLEDTPDLMGRVGEMVAEYHHAYQESVGKRQEAPNETDSTSVSEVDEVMYDMMGEAELLGEMSTLVGRLRYASEGQDKATINESVARLLAIGKRLPDNRKIDRIVAAATDLDDKSADLIRLYVDRAYALLREDYRRVGVLDGQIADSDEGAPGVG
jgi:hypothetical protein